MEYTGSREDNSKNGPSEPLSMTNGPNGSPVTKEESDKNLDLNTALGRVGGLRRWNLLAIFLIGISAFSGICWQGLGIVFIGKCFLSFCCFPFGKKEGDWGRGCPIFVEAKNLNNNSNWQVLFVCRWCLGDNQSVW